MMTDYMIILGGILGLDMSKQVDTKFMAYCIKDIENLDMFIDYCNDHKESVTYSKKNERLNTLATRFKKIEEDAKLARAKEQSKTYAKELADLVKMCRTYVEDNEDAKWKNIVNSETKEKVFAEHQLRALEFIGSENYIISLSCMHSLEDAIMTAYINKRKKKASYEALADNQKRMKELVSKIKV